MAQTLSLATLDQLPDAIDRPSYARSDLTAGIIHIGVGNFHRAHQAVYLDRLFEAGHDHDWAIVGAGIKPFDATKRAQLAGQDWLTTVVELAPDSLNARVTGAMIDFLDVDPAVVVQALQDPAIRIVSLTVTEGGYFVDARTGGFDAGHPEIAHDAEHPDDPQTVFGILIAALKARRDAGSAPFTVMSCDNLPENGQVARNAVLGLAHLIDVDLAVWISDSVAFPNGMVDCITPATSDAEVAMVRDTFGLEDPAPVTCEPFRQWVLEDHFPTGRPALERVGVEFVADVKPYELMKLRILNGGHAAIAYVGALLGHAYVAQAMVDPDIREWYLTLARSEIIPTLAPIPGVSYDAYLMSCVDRFSNAAVKDTIPRLCLDGSNRQPKFILPTIQDAISKGCAIDGLALEVALWCRYCAASAAPDAPFKLEDERHETLIAASVQTATNPMAFLGIDEVFGPLAGNAAFADAFSAQITALWQADLRAVLKGFAARAAA